MFMPKLGCTLRLFGLHWLNHGGYEITKNIEALKQSVHQMVDLGFETVELGTAGPWTWQEERMNFPFVQEAIGIIKESGLILNSVHLPISLLWWDFAALNEDHRVSVVNNLKEKCNYFKGNMPNYFVIHPSTTKDFIERERRIEQCIKSMKEISQVSDAAFCFENMTANGLINTTSEALQVLDAAPKIHMCIDMNHMLQESPQDFIRKIGNRIKTIHVSDRDEQKERHWMPNEGILDWQEIIKALDEIGYQGVFNYELSEDMPYTYAQMKDNYKKLFNTYNQK